MSVLAMEGGTLIPDFSGIQWEGSRAQFGHQEVSPWNP